MCVLLVFNDNVVGVLSLQPVVELRSSIFESDEVEHRPRFLKISQNLAALDRRYVPVLLHEIKHDRIWDYEYDYDGQPARYSEH